MSMVNQVLSVKDMIALGSQKKNVQQIRLKRYQFNLILIAYIRQVKWDQYYSKTAEETMPETINSGSQNDDEGSTEASQKTQAVDAGAQAGVARHQLLLSQVTDLKFELECVNSYLGIVKHFKHIKEDTPELTTLEEDLKLLLDSDDQSISWNTRMAVLFRSETKKLLRCQVETCELIKQVLEVAIEMQHGFITGKSQPKYHMHFKDAYLAYTPSEALNVKSNDEAQ